MNSVESFLSFRDVGRRLEELETPVPIIDLDVVEANVQNWQNWCNDHQVRNRPHIKTHKIAGLARYQIARGAAGIAVQKLGEAEEMADGGIAEMLFTFNAVGKPKLERLTALMKRVDIKVVADNTDMLAGLGWAAQRAGRTLHVLVECDTGMKRNGVQSPGDARNLAQAISKVHGLSFAGLMTYPAAGLRREVSAFLTEAVSLCQQSGLEVRIVSSGGTPDAMSEEGLTGLTEYRAGTNIYFDRSMLARKVCRQNDCALTMLTTVVSRPTADRAIIDAGSKALTTDLIGLTGYGVALDHDNALVFNINEEHGFVDVSSTPVKPKVGDLLRILPNHACPVSNLFDEVVMVRGDRVLGAVKVDARGKVQ